MRNEPAILLLATLLAAQATAQERPDWQAQVREQVAAKQFRAALLQVDQRLAAAPEDLEARGWRARLLGWSNRMAEAEVEYRKILEMRPGDADVLLGLADVVAWQGRYEEALTILDRAQLPEAQRAEAAMRRGRWLRALDRREESRAAFQEALRLDPSSGEAQAGLRSLEPEPRHELRLGGDFDHFAFAQDAQSITLRLHSRWGERWGTGVAGNFQHRFGSEAGRFLADVTYRPTKTGALTIGGGAGRDEGVIPKREAFFAYSHGFQFEPRGFVRGVEAGYHQQWFWYRAARILALTPGVVLYLPRDWSWALGVTAARSRFPGTPAEWRPSGSTRLNFPLPGRLHGSLFFGVGTENFAQVDQIGRFSARTYGGGLRWQMASRQELAGHLFYQDRSQGRTQTGFGMSYAVRF